MAPILFLSLLLASASASTAPTFAPAYSPSHSPSHAPAHSPSATSAPSPIRAPLHSSRHAHMHGHAPRRHPHPHTSVHTHPPVRTIPLIEKTCDLTYHNDLCIEALTAQPLAHSANPKQLAAITLRLAQQNATETSGYITGLMDQTDSEPNTQQCLSDCMEDYELALEQLDDAIAALDESVSDHAAHRNAMKWTAAAMDHVMTCQDECKGGAEHKNVLTVRNAIFNQLCSIGISIIKTLP